VQAISLKDMRRADLEAEEVVVAGDLLVEVEVDGAVLALRRRHRVEVIILQT
jgi:hypothetical protein